MSKCSTLPLMKTLRQYIEAANPKRTHLEWAQFFGISRSYFTEIVNGDVVPGTKVIRSIADATGGKVSPGVWFPPISRRLPKATDTSSGVM